MQVYLGEEKALNKLFPKSYGISNYTAAQEFRWGTIDQKAQAMKLFDQAIGQLEIEVRDPNLSPDERVKMLEALHESYLALCAESFLPPHHRIQSLPHEWRYYISMAAETNKQLEEARKLEILVKRAA